MSTQSQTILSHTSSAISHLHTLHYSVAIIALVSILAAVFWISKNKNKKHSLKVKLIQKNNLTHDTVVFTFLLPKSHQLLGLQIGEHIQIQANINGNVVKRKYTPISRIDRKETFELLIKIYPITETFPQGGLMSLYLDSLAMNAEINITLPYGRFNYVKDGNVKITSLEQPFYDNLFFSQKVLSRQYKNFFMVAGGTGITPLYQIIQYITENEYQHVNAPNITLLFANRSEDDILLRNELNEYQQKNPKLKVVYSVDKALFANWNGLVGFIDEQKIAKTICTFAEDIQNTVFLSCGPPILDNIVEGIWRKKYNVQPENMFRF